MLSHKVEDDRHHLSLLENVQAFVSSKIQLLEAIAMYIPVVSCAVLEHVLDDRDVFVLDGAYGWRSCVDGDAVFEEYVNDVTLEVLGGCLHA